MGARLSLDAGVDIKGLAEAARAAGRLGIDTEFMSEGRYRALLCLVGVGLLLVPGALLLGAVALHLGASLAPAPAAQPA